MTPPAPPPPLRLGLLGATGLVGREMLRVLDQRDFPLAELRLLASARSEGAELDFRGQRYRVRRAQPTSFDGLDLVLASAGGVVSRELLPAAVAAGAACVDNTSAFRLEDHVPLVVPEVNGHRIPDGPGLIANPNCSTIQLAVALAPLQQAFGLRAVTVATYQSASGAGQGALREFERADPRAVAVVPEIGSLLDCGESEEERKMRLELPKILEAAVEVEAWCVRVPVARGHGEAVWIETETPVDPASAAEVLRRAPGLSVVESAPSSVAGKDRVAVGRLRRGSHPRRLGLWVAADNLLKGAALNAVQIAERWRRRDACRAQER